jgi:tRNA modification GTPase
LWDDTIVAVATPLGESAIGVARLSGADAVPLVTKVFKGTFPQESHTARYGRLVVPDSGEVIDEIVVTYFKAPNSYTGEDVVEISAHGNPLILRDIVELFVALGARRAGPGEFTQRAYLNGKMDLTRAEAVQALISSHSRHARAQALSHMSGKFSVAVEMIRSEILDILAEIEAAVDHSDLNMEFESYDSVRERATKIVRSVDELLSTSKQGRMLRSGMKVAILGAPNTGKSSLMNLLLKEDRVIVSEHEGTTRDTVEDELVVKGIPVRIVDTAGVRKTVDPVEKKGVERTVKAVSNADFVVLLFDASRKPTDKDNAAFELTAGKNFVSLLNKSDLKAQTTPDALKTRYGVEAIPFSAVTGEGLDKLEESIEKFYYSFGFDPETDVLVINARQEDLLANARAALKDAMNALDQDLSEEFVAIEIRKARNFVEEIVGKSSDDEVLDRIFAKFCIGK